MRDLPYLIIKWVTYTNMQTLLAALAVRYPFLANAVNLLAGAIAGAIAAITVTPADVCKTRLQAARMDPAQKHVTTLQIGRDVVREGGVPALFSGLGPRLMRCAPASLGAPTPPLGAPPYRYLSLLDPTSFTAPTHCLASHLILRLAAPTLAMNTPRIPKQTSILTLDYLLLAGYRCTLPSRSPPSTWSRTTSLQTTCASCRARLRLSCDMAGRSSISVHHVTASESASA